MKKLDEYLIKFSIALLFISFIVGLIVDYVFTLKMMGLIIFNLYALFILGHFALCYPSIVVGMHASDYFEKAFKKMKEKSLIIAVLTRFIFVIVSVILVHVIWLYLGASLTFNEYHFIEVFKIMKNN